MAVVGTGASAVQCVPNIADKVEELHVFQRTAAWVPPRLDYVYPNWLKVIFMSESLRVEKKKIIQLIGQ